MSVKPLISGSVYLPFSLFSKPLASRVKKRLTFTVKAFHHSEEDRKIETFWLDWENHQIRVPFNYGLQLLQELDEEGDLTVSMGAQIGKPPKLPDPFHPLAPEGQDIFFNDLEAAMRSRRTVLAVAPTGSGKTAAALNAIGKIERAALIVVPSKELALQWRREIKKHLGLDEKDIGLLEGGKCFYQGKKIVIAVIHNIFQRRLSTSFKSHFGIVVWDEAHRLGAEKFSETFGMFNAKVRVGLTATPERKDGMAQIVYDCLGEPCVTAGCDALPCQVRIVDHPTKMPEWRYLGRGTLITRLTKNESRNIAICQIVKTLHNRGRNVLVLSDRVEHLQLLMSASLQQGIPEEDMGLYTRSFYYDEKDEKGKVIVKKGVFKEDELKDVRENARVIFSTYGMGKEAIDIPRLDAGIDATPRADGVQAIGRIRRPMAGKKLPVWFTIRDTTIPILVNMTMSRARDYGNSNQVEVIDHGQA